MSVSQVKKRFDDLESYLGRDVAGREKLRQLKDSVGVLRNSLSAAESRADDAIRCRDHAHAQSVADKHAADLANAECNRLRQIVENLTRDNRLLSSRIEAMNNQGDNEQVLASNESDAIKTVKRLKRNVSVCPQPSPCDDGRRAVVDVHKFKISKFAKDWSYESIWTLGAAVAVLSSLMDDRRTVVTFECDIWPTDLGDQNSDNSLGGHVIRWCRKLINNDEVDSATLAADTTRYNHMMKKPWLLNE